LELPKDAVSVMNSKYSKNEFFVFKDRMISTQQHPDFSTEFLDLQIVKGISDLENCKLLFYC
jgi:GMP synthase-like glutamine amidotransferase